MSGLSAGLPLNLSRSIARGLPRNPATGPVAPPFDPGTLFAASEQGFWYDPSDLSSMWQDSAGTVPVTATGDPVGKINDKSGRGNHATQATSANKPTLQIVSGKYYLLFDGVDDFVAPASIDFSTTDKMSIFAGARKASDAAFAPIVETGTNWSSPAGGFVLSAPSGAAGANYQIYMSGATSGSSGIAIAGYAAPTTNVLTAQIDLAHATVEGTLRINAVLAASSGVGCVGNFAAQIAYIGRRAGANSPFTGNIYSLIVRAAATSNADRDGAESYVNGKTGAY